jgi:hypothetical protein
MWGVLALFLLGCATGPSRAPGVLALRSGAYAQPGGSGSSSPAQGVPLTMARLMQLARVQGIGITGAQVTRLREVGLAFQGTALRSLNLPQNTRKYPAPGRGGPYAFVIPDAVVVAGRIQTLGGISFDPGGGFVEVADECLDFMEMKARSCMLTLSSARRQMAGLIDALSRQRPRGRSLLGPQPPRPGLLLVTTADTQVGQDVLFEAGRHGVAIFQAVAYEEGGSITVGAFWQRTGFADVPRQFSFPSVPEVLKK